MLLPRNFACVLGAWHPAYCRSYSQALLLGRENPRSPLPAAKASHLLQAAQALPARVSWCAHRARSTARVARGNPPTAPTRRPRGYHRLLLPLLVRTCADDEKIRSARACGRGARPLRASRDSSIISRGARVVRSFPLRFRHIPTVYASLGRRRSISKFHAFLRRFARFKARGVDQ